MEENKIEIAEIEVKKDAEGCDCGNRRFYTVGTFIAAVLILAGVCYYGSIISKKLDKLADNPSGNVLGQNNQAPDNNLLKNQQPSGKIAVAQRQGEPVLGKSDAKVSIYEFSDFQCPYCKRFINDAYAQIKSKYIDTGKAKIIFRNFPLPGHVNAQKAAEAAECANLQGKFWEYHNLLFKNGQADGAGLAAADLKKYAGTLGLDQGKFNACLDNGQATAAIAQDMKDAQNAGITGTPSFIINGKLIVGAQAFSTFEQAIEQALK